MLGFELVVTPPEKYLHRYLSVILRGLAGRDYDGMNGNKKEEFGVVEATETMLGKRSQEECVKLMIRPRVALGFPARTIAAVAVLRACEVLGYRVGQLGEWVDRVGEGKVDLEDVRECLDMVEEEELEERRVLRGESGSGNGSIGRSADVVELD